MIRLDHAQRLSGIGVLEHLVDHLLADLPLAEQHRAEAPRVRRPLRHQFFAVNAARQISLHASIGVQGDQVVRRQGIMRLLQGVVGQQHAVLDNDARTALLVDPEAVKIVAEGQNAVDLLGKILGHHKPAADLFWVRVLGDEFHPRDHLDLGFVPYQLAFALYHVLKTADIDEYLLIHIRPFTGFIVHHQIVGRIGVFRQKTL